MPECSALDAADRLRSSLTVLRAALVALDGPALLAAEEMVAAAVTDLARVSPGRAADAARVRTEIAASRALLAGCRQLTATAREITHAALVTGYGDSGGSVMSPAMRGGDLNTRL
jgi:hypothetical protein